MTTRLSTLAVCALLLAAGLSPADAQTQTARRPVGAHQHGIGTLDIAIDGQNLRIELEVSAGDIVGFETEPTTPEQEAALAGAEETMRDPAALFALPPAANCRLRNVSVERDVAEPAVPREAAASPHHMDLRARFDMMCTRAPTTMTLTLFKKFPRVGSFYVRTAGRRGQGRAVASDVMPHVDLARVN